MGAAGSVQTAIRDIKTLIVNELKNTASSTAEADCEMKISFKAKRIDRCNVTVENQCSVKAEASISAVFQAVNKINDTYSAEFKAQSAKYFTMSFSVQTDINRVHESIINKMTNDCEAKSSTISRSDLTIEIEECMTDPSSPVPTELTFINAGHAESNCMIKVIMDMENEAINDHKLTMTSNADDWVTYAIIAAVILLGFGFYKYLASRRMEPQERIDLKLAEQDNFFVGFKSLLLLFNSPKNRRKKESEEEEG